MSAVSNSADFEIDIDCSITDLDLALFASPGWSELAAAWAQADNGHHRGLNKTEVERLRHEAQRAYNVLQRTACHALARARRRIPATSSRCSQPAGCERPRARPRRVRRASISKRPASGNGDATGTGDVRGDSRQVAQRRVTPGRVALAVAPARSVAVIEGDATTTSELLELLQ